MNSRLEGVFGRVLALRVPILVAYAILVPAAAWLATRIPSEAGIDRLLVASDPDTVATRAFQRIFPEAPLVLLLVEAEDPFAPEVLARTQALESALRAVPGVTPYSALDVLAAAVTAGAIALEATADAQLHAFLRARGDPAAILDRGLWARSRHPNYLGEILFWWGLFLFGVSAAPRWAWTAVGPLAITALFLLVSVPWMDRRMLARHPAYAERLRTTPALIPWPRRRRG